MLFNFYKFKLNKIFLKIKSSTMIHHSLIKILFINLNILIKINLQIY